MTTPKLSAILPLLFVLLSFCTETVSFYTHLRSPTGSHGRLNELFSDGNERIRTSETPLADLFAAAAEATTHRALIDEVGEHDSSRWEWGTWIDLGLLKTLMERMDEIQPAKDAWATLQKAAVAAGSSSDHSSAVDSGETAIGGRGKAGRRLRIASSGAGSGSALRRSPHTCI